MNNTMTAEEILENNCTSTIEWKNGTEYFKKEEVLLSMEEYGKQCYIFEHPDLIPKKNDNITG